jgi:hypothetical protein
LPIDSQDDINEEIKSTEKKIYKNKRPNLKYSLYRINKKYQKKIKNNSTKPDSDNSRNDKMNFFFKNKQYNSYNAINSIINHKKNKKIEFDDDLIYICYNDQEKPTKIKLYKINKKKEKGTPLKFRPRTNEGYIKGLSLNKKLRSILLNKDGNNKSTFSSSDHISVTKKPKTINNTKNIIKRNIEYIKKVEKKTKKESSEKNIKKRNNSSSRGKIAKSKEKSKTKKIIKDNKEKISNKTNNESLKNIFL